jgi:hypothetical protein
MLYTLKKYITRIIIGDFSGIHFIIEFIISKFFSILGEAEDLL